MTTINPNKLVRNLEVQTSTEGELRLYWDSPKELTIGEELVLTRRKDAFPVEIRNRNFEDRYTDVAQVEVFRGSPLYCSHLILLGNNTLGIAGDNSFIPALSEFERDNKYTGRLIRDEQSQVFRITGNTESEIYYENISTNSEHEATTPVDGAFVILADFTKDRSNTRTFSLLQNANTLTIVNNSFIVGDIITVNNTINLVFGTDWTSGVTEEETASNLKSALELAGVDYQYSLYGSTILIEKGSESTLSITSTNPNAEVYTYAAARGKVFINESLGKNILRNRVLQDGDVRYSHIKNNEGSYIELYTEYVAPATDVHVIDSHNNTYPSGFIDTYKSQSEQIRKSGSGLEADVFYYYTLFTTPLTSVSITYNEEDLYGENPLPYTIDKISPYYVRVFYESLKYNNNDIGDYSYDSVSGELTYSDGRDLSAFDIQIGDLFADNLGKRYSILDVSNLASGVIGLATGLTVGTNPQNRLHGAVTASQVPVGFGDIEVGDTFKDIAGSSFQIYGTSSSPLASVSTPPSHAFDIGQGLIDKNIMLNPFLVPFSYNPSDGKIQYGELVITQNNQLSPYNYNSLSGIVTYTTNIELGDVEVGQFFIDGSNNQFEIVSINPTTLEVGLDTGLTVDNTVANRRSGAIISQETFVDVETGDFLIDIESVEQSDLFKTNSKADYVITDVDAANGALYITDGLDSISLLVSTEFDGSVYRRGSDVTWIGFDNENEVLLSDSNLGAIRRFSSVNNTQFAYFSNSLSTQAFAISAANNGIQELLYKWWPSVFRDLDSSGDLEDLMNVFGYKFNEIYSLISTYELQNADLIQPRYLAQGYRNGGLGEVSETLGIDTRRRIMKDLVSAWKLKGSREGVAKFIKIITTWDVTNGTGDIVRAIQDSTPDTSGLRHYSPALGSLNTEIVDTTIVKSPPAGRFVRGIPGLNLAGFFSQVEIQIELPNVAMFVGNSTSISQVTGNTIIQDNTAEFGQINGLKGCFLIPMEGSPNDYYEILSNDEDTITVDGTIPPSVLGNKYVVLSPLNLNRFVALQSTITEQLSYKSIPVFTFTVKTL